MQLPSYSVNGKLAQLQRGLNIIQQFPDASGDLRIKNNVIKTSLSKNFQILDISRNIKAEHLKQQNRTWPVSRKAAYKGYGESFQKFKASNHRDRYIKVFLLILTFSVFIYLFFRLFEISI